MTAVLEQDARAIHRALETAGEQISVNVSRETAQFLAAVIDARAQGQEVVVTRGLQEVTTTEAAKLLGMSRPQVGKLMDRGRLPYRLVGTHHRIPASAIDAFLDIESKRQHAAMAELVALQNELGLTE